MLNELAELESGWTALGMGVAGRHPDLAQLRKGNVIRGRLNATGLIDELELLDGKTRSDIWTLRDGKHNGFPGMNTARGLLDLSRAARAAHVTAWKSAKSSIAKRDEITRLVQENSLDPKLATWPRYRERISKRLSSLLPMRDRRETAAVPAVFERFLKALERDPPFIRAMFDAILERVELGDDTWLDVARTALTEAFPLAIDVTRDFVRDAGDPRQINPVSQLLISKTEKAITVKRGQACALRGDAVTLVNGRFPGPNLPGIGETYLFSRNKDIPALARYGRNGPSAFPVGADLVGRFSGILSDISAEERKGKTWRRLPTETGEGQDLFIVFLASGIDLPVADAFAEDMDEPQDGRQSIEAIGTEVIDFWKGIADKAKPDETVRIIILRTIDLGNRKAIFDRRPTVAALHNAARIWIAAMGNSPDWVDLPVFVKRQLVFRHPTFQAPLSVIALSKKLFVRGGRDERSAPGVSGAEALALFLQEGDHWRRARKLLGVLLSRHGCLLSGIAHARRRDGFKDFDPKGTLRVAALRAVSWFGALLFLLRRTKDTYMNDAGFKLGQLLSAADAVHLGYCTNVRGGQIPPTLVGNSVFAAAGRSPFRALDQLYSRWKPYQAWADRADYILRRETPAEGDARDWAVIRALNQARHAARLGGEVHALLAEMAANGRPVEETFRAELLLGYLAGIKSET